MYDKLIGGKDPTERIVHIEINDNEAHLFFQNKFGETSEEIRPNRFWTLLVKPCPGAVKLSGNLHYQYGIQFNSKKEWNDFNYKLRKKNLDFFVMYDPTESYMINKGSTYFKGMTHTEPSILSFDIESTGLFHNSDSKVLLISNTFRKLGKITRKLFAYDDYASQGEMLQAWCSWIREMDPSIIAGHNIYTFDFPYLNFIAEQEGIELNLGRDGSPLYIADRASKFRIDGSRDQEYHKVRVYGRSVIDTMFLAIRHDIVAKKYESYGLKNIIKAEGLEIKDRVFYDASQIRFKYKDPTEWAKIKEYCIHDSDDGLAVFDLCGPASFYLAQVIPKSFQSIIETAPGSQLNSMMIRAYLQDGHSLPKATPVQSYSGGISFGVPGIYKNLLKIDIKSMYPSILLQYQYNNKEKDPKGYFLYLVKYFFNTRKTNKDLFKKTGDRYYDDMQNAMKIAANSLYGFLGTPGLLFNDPPGAAFVTKTGREILEHSIIWATGKNHKYWQNLFEERTK